MAAIFQLLIAKGDVLWRHRHQLHGESKHHDDDQNAYNTQSLWHSVSSFYFEKFQTEEIDADFDDSIENANENIEQKIDLFIHISKNVISQQSDEIESVDMRYDKGFTILWKNVPLAS